MIVVGDGWRREIKEKKREEEKKWKEEKKRKVCEQGRGSRVCVGHAYP